MKDRLSRIRLHPLLGLDKIPDWAAEALKEAPEIQPETEKKENQENDQQSKRGSGDVCEDVAPRSANTRDGSSKVRKSSRKRKLQHDTLAGIDEQHLPFEWLDSDLEESPKGDNGRNRGEVNDADFCITSYAPAAKRIAVIDSLVACKVEKNSRDDVSGVAGLKSKGGKKGYKDKAEKELGGDSAKEGHIVKEAAPKGKPGRPPGRGRGSGRGRNGRRASSNPGRKSRTQDKEKTENGCTSSIPEQPDPTLEPSKPDIDVEPLAPDTEQSNQPSPEVEVVVVKEPQENQVDKDVDSVEPEADLLPDMKSPSPAPVGRGGNRGRRGRNSTAVTPIRRNAERAGRPSRNQNQGITPGVSSSAGVSKPPTSRSKGGGGSATTPRSGATPRKTDESGRRGRMRSGAKRKK